ncbi:MAG: beta-N-acetylhexosaminidase [Longimicrobiales bacterium]
MVAGGCAPRAALRGPPESMELRYPIIPRPASLQPAAGEFVLDSTTRIIVVGEPADEARAAVSLWAEPVRRASGLALPLVPEDGLAAGRGAIRITLVQDAAPAGEGYRVEVTPRGVLLSASTVAGLTHGLQTLRQLLPSVVERTIPFPGMRWAIPAVTIDDAPRFSYRGMHLDVGRHFFPVDFIKRYIDLLALYKFNTFHWHLTEDQGWRIEIRKYPRLTSVAAWRKETVVEKNFDPYIGDGTPYGGFYTQDQVREVVAYAMARSITVIPEIELPGHSLAALAAYPELACTPGPFEVGTRWGVFEDIYCPSEQTFGFLEDVLTEVMALFPSRYIHIGGDEAPKARWKASPVAQEVIRREGLKDEAELQSYFIQRIERFLAGHGRRLIGWDEILEGGLAPEATVMSWRGMDGGIEAARQGHDVIMTPTSHVYFDYYQGPRETEPFAIGGFTPLEKVYAFEPLPPALTAQEAKHVLGAQGNVWTEYMKTTDHVEYMVLPRMIALSEVLWSPASARDYPRFLERLRPQLARLDARGIRYRKPFARVAPAGAR